MTRARILRASSAIVVVLMLAAPGARAADTAAGDQKDPARAITSQLICPCSCGEVLSGCTCETGIALKGYVDRELTAGKDKDTIEASLIAKYGEVILGAPKAKGFNLVVWVAPFVATLLGFGIASMVLFRWVRQKREGLAAVTPASTPSSPDHAASMEAYRARVEADIRELKE
jgi:cytochrome c-type biogenesis protein CcmH/NrfF